MGINIDYDNIAPNLFDHLAILPLPPLGTLSMWPSMDGGYIGGGTGGWIEGSYPWTSGQWWYWSTVAYGGRRPLHLLDPLVAPWRYPRQPLQGRWNQETGLGIGKSRFGDPVPTLSPGPGPRVLIPRLDPSLGPQLLIQRSVSHLGPSPDVALSGIPGWI